MLSYLKNGTESVGKMGNSQPSNFWLKDTIYTSRPDHPLALLLVFFSVLSVWFAFQVSSLTVVLVFLCFFIADEAEEKINQSLGGFGGTRLIGLGLGFAWIGLIIWSFFVLVSLLYRETPVMIMTEPVIMLKVL